MNARNTLFAMFALSSLAASAFAQDWTSEATYTKTVTTTTVTTYTPSYQTTRCAAVEQRPGSPRLRPGPATAAAADGRARPTTCSRPTPLQPTARRSTCSRTTFSRLSRSRVMFSRPMFRTAGRPTCR